MTARLLVASNGHGEDAIACRILDALAAGAAPPRVEAWPMVGTGAAFRDRGVPVIGPGNLLPSEGFGTLTAGHLARDLKAGFVATYLRQARFARSLRGRADLVLAVGDIVPLAAGWLAGTPTAFVACAKSAWYGGRDAARGGHNRIERALMRRCAAVFPRDSRTAQGLRAAGVPCHDLGNPMMDGLAGQGHDDLAPPGTVALALLPGSRRDATENAALLMAAGAALAARHDRPTALRLLMAAHPAVDLAAVARAPGWAPAGQGPLRLTHPAGAQAIVATDRFADILHAATLALGMAGTANEQAVGLGLPLIAVPGSGNQGEAFARMKQRYFGPAALPAPRDAEAIAPDAADLLADPARRAAMAAAGRARMGPAGATQAIAAVLSGLLRPGGGGTA